MKQIKTLRININNLSKQYGEQSVFSDFSYSFESEGFYLLFGESGCGKTTLLNILSGMTSFDGGRVQIFSQKFEGTVNWDDIRDITGYVTQDTVLIDYLSVGEQLELSGADNEVIINTLALFGLERYYNCYPNQLSGGERQRIAVIQAILWGKQILLLDEPTASLDENNKLTVFETLKKVSESILVICASHDACAKEYADNIIYFDKEKTESAADNTVEYQQKQHKKAQNEKKVSLYPYFRKWFLYKKRDKHSLIYLLLIYIITFVFLLIGDNPSNKTQESIEHIYKINHCISTVTDNGNELFSVLEGTKKNVEAVMIYNGSAPDITVESTSHDTTVFGVLPFNEDLFRLSDKLACGNYFTDSNQVILSYNKALEYGEAEALIGEHITLDLYDGRQSFEIVGVFDKFSDVEAQYMLAGCIENYDSCIYINSKYTEKFQDDTEFNWLGQRTYVLYFNSFSEMNDFYSKNCDNKNLRLNNQNVDYSMIQRFEILFYILYPLSFLIMLFSLLFCFQSKSIELIYNKHLFSVYDYLGFTKKEIRSCWIKGTASENLFLLILSFLIANGIAIIINLINEHFNILPLRIFTFNFYLIGFFVIIDVFFVSAMSFISFRKIKAVTWKDLFSEQRDLW